MPGGIFLYISQVTLSVVSLWTLNLSYGYDFACGGLAMYFLSSSLGLIARILGKPSWISSYKEAEYCSFVCALPLLNAQVCSDARILPKWLLYGITFFLPAQLLMFRYLTDTDDLDVRPVHVIHYANILTMLYTGFVRNEEAYLIAHSYVICHHILLPISTVCYNFGLSLLCLNWLIYKHNSSSIFFEDFVSVSQQIKTWF
ncbi:uncharacterized protein [Rhodnius prolixus]|uniref:uncharacterized protein n=1 Tax=Rhodnius prolixus TaxID=13249 RepID=UPI003D188CDD